MTNLASLLWAQADEQPEKTAIRSLRMDLTYGDLRDRSKRVAGAVIAAGIQPLDRVVLIAPTIPEFAIVYYGLHAAGVSVITMNTMATASEIGYVLEDSGACLVIAWHESVDSARKATGEHGIDLWEIGEGAEFDAEPVEVAHERGPEDTAVILYTSGTTGQPKGAELTTSNLHTMATTMLEGMDFTPEDRFCSGLPLFHVYGQVVVMNMSLLNGASVSLVAPFDPKVLLATVQRDRITLLAGVPTMWNAMLQEAKRGTEVDFSSLRVGSSGGAALPLEVLREFQEEFGCTLLEGYGLTETTSSATTHTLNIPQKAGTVGVAAPGVEVELRDTENRPVEAGVVGEVFVKGPVVMKGYWNRPEATAETLMDGWMRTGDLGMLDEDGYLSIVDRLKDLIIRGGYNVYPREVEEALYEHPDVVEVAVVGVPDEHLGEEIVAVVTAREGALLTASELREFSSEKLSAYKVPRLYRFVDELPKGSTGKILKRALNSEELTSMSVRG